MADRFVNLFEPDTLLPDQYFAAFAREGCVIRERKLMLAILRDAVECYQKHALARDPKGRLLFDDAEDWISSGERDWPFSYENICDVLGLNPQYLRRGLSKWRQQKGPLRRTVARIVPVLDKSVEPGSGLLQAS